MQIRMDTVRYETPVGGGSGAARAEASTLLAGTQATLLTVTARPSVLSVAAQAGRVAVEIGCAFTALYTDETGETRAAQAQTTVSATVDAEGVEAGDLALATLQVDEANGEAAGGRVRFTALLTVGVCAFSPRQAQVVADVDEGPPLVSRETRLRTARVIGRGQLRQMLTDTAAVAAEARPLACEPLVRSLSARAGESSVTLDGEILATVILSSPLSPYFTQEVILPYTLSVEVAGARFGMEALGSVEITDCTVALEDEGLRVECVVQASAAALQSVDVPVLTDVYSIGEQTVEATTQTLVALSGASAYSQTMELAQAIPVSSAGRLLGTQAQLTFLQVTQEGKAFIAEGLIKLDFLIQNEDGALIASPSDLPFRLSYPGSTQACAFRLDILSAQAALQSESVADVQLQLRLSALSYTLDEADAVTNLTETDESVQRRPGLTLYYPLPGEDGWQVAKRFHVPADAVTLHAGTALIWVGG